MPELALDGLTAEFAGALGADAVAPAGPPIDGLTPRLTITPRRPDGVAWALQTAARLGLAVTPTGGGTRLTLGNAPQQYDIALSTAALDRVTEYEPADLTVTVEAGMTLAGLAARLAPHGQFVPLEAPLPARATIGGALMTASSGALRAAYGGPRDLLLGVRLAQPNGEVIRAGARVVKNVAGYEFPKLVIGSLGTLGVLTEVSLRVFPIPVAPLTLVATLPAAALAQLARGVTDRRLAPLALDCFNATAARAVGLGSDHGWYGAIAVAGKGAVRERAERDLAELVAGVGGRIIERGDGYGHDVFWAALRDLGRAAPVADLAIRASLPPAAAATFGADAPRLVAPDAPEAVSVVVRPLIGTVEIAAFGAGLNGAETAALAVGRLRQAAAPQRGSVVVERCPTAAKALLDVWGVPEGPALTLMREIRRQFDPARTLNPGRYVGRL